MDLPFHLWTDLREFFGSVGFARPELLWLAVVPVVISLVGFLARRKRRNEIAAVGETAAVAALVVGQRTSREVQLASVAAWALIVVGAAGPRWGAGDDEGVAVGRDVVIVLDLSRSMLADDTATGLARWQAAVAGAGDLIDGLRARGGHRAAIVVFAARPTLLVPLTTDYDHLKAKLAELDGKNPPPEVRPGEDGLASGTRIGAALTAAVAAHDPRFSGYQDIVLISDGDDPADDREWAAGVSAARAANIPVHVVGVGDPDHASPIDVNGQPLEAVGPNGLRDWVRTRLREDVLTAIATEGRGVYLPARRDVPRLGEFFRTKIEPNPSRELTDDAFPRPKDRSAWFLAAALLFAFAWRREG